MSKKNKKDNYYSMIDDKKITRTECVSEIRRHVSILESETRRKKTNKKEPTLPVIGYKEIAKIIPKPEQYGMKWVTVDGKKRLHTDNTCD